MTLVKMVKHKWQWRKMLIKNYISASKSISSLNKRTRVLSKYKEKKLSFLDCVVILLNLIF